MDFCHEAITGLDYGKRGWGGGAVLFCCSRIPPFAFLGCFSGVETAYVGVRFLFEQHDTLHHPSGGFFWKFLLVPKKMMLYVVYSIEKFFVCDFNRIAKI